MSVTNPTVYLVQTDTTVGFVSSDKNKLASIKKRDPQKPILQTLQSFDALKKKVRVPQRFKKEVRRSKKTTFIYPNAQSFRVVCDKSHLRFLDKITKAYSTSANESTKKYNFHFAYAKADVIVYQKDLCLSPSGASNIIVLGKYTKRRIR